jgi:hypothetical protein
MYRWTSIIVKIVAVATPLLTACTSLPNAELTAYTTAYSDTQVITNSVLPPPCADPIDPNNPYCYNICLGYADIGAPPLVAAYRNLSDVVARFNSLMVAYSNGVTGPLLKQELDGLANSVSQLSKLPPISAVNGAAGLGVSFQAVISEIIPIASFIGPFVDRAQLRAFLITNYNLVDKALDLMGRSSPELYANVAVGTRLFRREASAGSASQALVTRQKEIRRLIANWTVLLDDTRHLLSDLEAAVEDLILSKLASGI